MQDARMYYFGERKEERIKKGIITDGYLDLSLFVMY